MPKKRQNPGKRANVTGVHYHKKLNMKLSTWVAGLNLSGKYIVEIALSGLPKNIYSSCVAANSVTGFGDPSKSRRNSALYPIAGAFFVPAMLCYGGCAWETFVSAGFLDSRFANLRTAATLNRLATVRGSSSNQGVPLCLSTPKICLLIPLAPQHIKLWLWLPSAQIPVYLLVSLVITITCNALALLWKARYRRQPMTKLMPLTANTSSTPVLLIDMSSSYSDLVEGAEYRLDVAKELMHSVASLSPRQGSAQDLSSVANAAYLLLEDASDLFKAARKVALFQESRHV